MARSSSRDTRALLLAVFTAFATLLLSSLAFGRAVADTPVVAPGCDNVIYAGNKTAPPSCPTDVTVTPGYQLLTVTWQAPVNNGGAPVTSYEVQISTDNGLSWTTVPAAPPAGPNLPPGMTNVVSGLTPGTNYFFQVAGVNALGVGNFSPITTPSSPLGARVTTLTAGHNKSLVRGSSTVLRVTLADVASGVTIPGESVVLHRRIGTSGAWHFVTFAQTTKRGVAAATVTPRVATEYRWTFASDSDFTPSTSGVQTVTVRRY